MIAGFGDTGLLTAIELSGRYDVVGVSPKPLLLSGQELGVRLTRPQEWKRDYLVPFRRYKRLDDVETVHGRVERIDHEESCVEILEASGAIRREAYDALVIASGVTNGFWRTAGIEDEAEIERQLEARARRIAEASCVAIVGGGATAVSVAANVAGRARARAQTVGLRVHLFHPRDEVLPGYHPRVRARITEALRARGVLVHPQHRAETPALPDDEAFTKGPVSWSTGQPDFEADLVLWATGSSKPNTGFLPGSMLDDSGYVRVDAHLRVPGTRNVFAIGDAAATDPHRSSARNWGYRVTARNVHAYLTGREDEMKAYEPPSHRWGSILGLQENGLEVFQPNGGHFRFPRWTVEKLLFPLAVRRGIYRGMRKP